MNYIIEGNVINHQYNKIIKNMKSQLEAKVKKKNEATVKSLSS